jgi:hypothetical protein
MQAMPDVSVKPVELRRDEYGRSLEHFDGWDVTLPVVQIRIAVDTVANGFRVPDFTKLSDDYVLGTISINNDLPRGQTHVLIDLLYSQENGRYEWYFLRAEGSAWTLITPQRVRLWKEDLERASRVDGYSGGRLTSAALVQVVIEAIDMMLGVSG